MHHFVYKPITISFLFLLALLDMFLGVCILIVVTGSLLFAIGLQRKKSCERANLNISQMPKTLYFEAMLQEIQESKMEHKPSSLLRRNK